MISSSDNNTKEIQSNQNALLVMVSTIGTKSRAKTGKQKIKVSDCKLVVVVPPLVKVFTSRNED